MAELVDALRSGRSSRKGVKVQILSWAPSFQILFAIQRAPLALTNILGASKTKYGFLPLHRTKNTGKYCDNKDRHLAKCPL